MGFKNVLRGIVIVGIVFYIFSGMFSITRAIVIDVLWTIPFIVLYRGLIIVMLLHYLKLTEEVKRK